MLVNVNIKKFCIMNLLYESSIKFKFSLGFKMSLSSTAKYKFVLVTSSDNLLAKTLCN